MSEEKVETKKEEEVTSSVELVEKKPENSNDNDDIDIPETLAKYNSVIEGLKTEYLQLSKELLDGFDGSDIMLLINSFTKTIAELRNVIEKKSMLMIEVPFIIY